MLFKRKTTKPAAPVKASKAAAPVTASEDIRKPATPREVPATTREVPAVSDDSGSDSDVGESPDASGANSGVKPRGTLDKEVPRR